MLEIILDSGPSTDALVLRFEASSEGDSVDAVCRIEQSPILVEYRFPTDTRELLEWATDLERLHATLGEAVVYPKYGPLQVAVSVGDRGRGRLEISASLRLHDAMRTLSRGGDQSSSPPAIFRGFATDQSFLPAHVASLRGFLDVTGKSRRLEVVEVELGGVVGIEEMHRAFADALGFPDFYGCNIAAFHDAITGLVVMPRTLVLRGWTNLLRRFPREAVSVEQVLRAATDTCSVRFTLVLA